MATVGSRSITLSEVDSEAGEKLIELQDKLFELRMDVAERIAIEHLIEDEAKRANLTPPRWIELNIEIKVAEPTEDALRELFDNVRHRLKAGTEFEDVKTQLRDVLRRDARAGVARELFDKLLEKAGYSVQLDEPPRVRREVQGTGPTKGLAGAPISIVVFADFQCPYCSKSAKTVAKVQAAYPGKVTVTFRHFPLSFHEDAKKAAEAAQCAHEQGKFWEYHDALYANQRALEVSDLKEYAFRIGLEVDTFERCLDSGRMSGVVSADMKEGERLGVSGTPAYFVNGLMLSGAQPEEKFRRIIDRELSKKNDAAPH